MTDLGPQPPAGLVRIRTSPTWDQDSLPKGLLHDHRIAEGVWGRLVVEAGSIEFTFDDEGTARTVRAGDAMVIPPGRLHHVTPVGPVELHVDFLKERSA